MKRQSCWHNGTFYPMGMSGESRVEPNNERLTNKPREHYGDLSNQWNRENYEATHNDKEN